MDSQIQDSAPWLGISCYAHPSQAALNYGEAQAAESKRDFVHKAQVILKELRESGISLKLLQRRSLITDAAVVKESKELVAIFTASVKTAKRSL